MALITTMVFRYDKTNANGIGPIYLRLTKNRKVSYISTGKRIHEKFWDKNSSKVKPSYPNSTQMNNYLNKLLLNYEEQLLKEESVNFNSSLRAIKGKISGKDNADFLSLSESLIAHYYAIGKIGTYSRTNSIINKLKDYHKKAILLFTEISPKFLSDYELHLRNYYSNKTNTVHSNMKFIRRVFNEAYRFTSLDEQGWTDVSVLLDKMNSKCFQVSMEILERIVATNNKSRFAFNEDKTKIRANQGHSISINLGLEPLIPPVLLYHGTGEKAVASILQSGLNKGNRHHVHLNIDIQTAIKVGQRHGRPVVIKIEALKMHEQRATGSLSPKMVSG